MKRLFLVLFVVGACGDDDDPGLTPDAAPTFDAPSGNTLADFLPEVPAPDGTARSTFAGPITDPADLIPGQASSGLVGDFFMRSSRARFVIQAGERSIGIVPFGGNVIDAVALGDDGEDLSTDHLGELGLIYLAGRTCNHTAVEVLRDGAGGGPAVIRATGTTAVNDYVNLRGLAALPVPPPIDPDLNEDGAGCATTYTLRPGSSTLEIAWTLFNPGSATIQGPFGMLNDVGGEVQIFSPRLGFSSLGGSISQITEAVDVAVPYQVYQAPGVAYGIVPRLSTPDKSSAGLVISGAAIFIFGARTFLDVLDRKADYLILGGDSGVTHHAELVVARDGAGVEAVFRRGRDETVRAVSGRARFSPGDAPARARVTVYSDPGADGDIDETDPVLTYFETRDDGTFEGEIPPGSYLFRADVPGVSRSPVRAVEIGAEAAVVPDLALPEPATFDFTVVDDADARVSIPVKITVIGRNPVAFDERVQNTGESRFGVVATKFNLHGSTLADPADAPLILPAGGPYRIFFSRGPEWSVASLRITAEAGARVTLPQVRLRRVLDTSGYIATAFHEHAIGSPDSAVPFDRRLASLLVEGIEFFAGTDHDHLSDYDPYIDAAGVRHLIDAVVGVETTPFAYGHFNAYPMELDPTDPSGGAPDWGAGMNGYAMLPGEIFADMRARGARVVQVSHPRSAGISTFQGFFHRAGLFFDFAARTYGSNDLLQDVPSEWLRLPEDRAVFSDAFDALEVWNNLSRGDTDGDGVPEMTGLDVVLRDWMNFLSLGKIYAPVGNGDTHSELADTAGMPRSLVRVPDDSEAGLTAGLEEDVWSTLGAGTPRDLVVTDGPMLRVTDATGPMPGRVVAATGGQVTLEILAQSAGYADIDTIEVLANATFDRRTGGAPSSLQPVACFTTRTGLHANDPCGLAPWEGGAQELDVETVDAGNGFTRQEARVTVTLRAEDIPNRAGAVGDDAWVVVRVRGRGSLFPIIPGDAVTSDNLDTILDGDDAEIRAAVRGRSAFPLAFTAPIFVDFDGGGYRAPFVP